MSRPGALRDINGNIEKPLEENGPINTHLKINVSKTDQILPSLSEEDAEKEFTPKQKIFAARQRYIAKVMEKTSSAAPSPSDITPSTGFMNNLVSSTDFDKVFSSNLAKSEESADDGKPFISAHSDKHLLASLTSARGSIASLETANKDLLDALSSRHKDLEKVKLESTEWKDKYDRQKNEMANLIKENSRLEGALADRDTLISVRDEELRQATQKIENLSNQLFDLESKGFEKELKNLQDTINSLKISLDDQAAKNVSKDEKLAAAQEKIDNLLSEIEELGTEKELADAKRNEMSTKDREDLEKAIHDFACECSANELLHEENGELREKIELLTKELASSKKCVGANSSEMVIMTMKIQSLTRDIDHLNKSLSDRDALLVQRDDEVREARLKIEQLLSELSHLKAQTDHHISSGNATASELETAMMKIASLEEELAAFSLSEDIQGAMQRLQDLNKQLESKLATQTKTMEALLSDHSSLGDEHSAIKGELVHIQETAAAEIKEVTTLLDEALHALAHEKCANDLHLEEELTLKAHLDSVHCELHILKDTLFIKTSELDQSNKHKQELEVEIYTLRQALDDIQIQLNDHEENSFDSQRSIARHVAQVKKMEEALRDVEADIAVKEKNVNEAQIKLTDLKEEINGLRDKNAILENDIQYWKAEITGLNSRLASATSKADRYEAKNKELRCDIDEKIRREHELMEELANTQHQLKSNVPQVAEVDEMTISSLEKELEEAKQAAAQTLADLNSVTLECRDFKARYESSCERLALITEEDNKYRNKIDDLKFQLYKITVDSANEINALEKSNAELKEVLEAEKTKTIELAAFKIKFSSERQRLSTLEADYSKQCEIIDYLKGQLAMVQVDMERKLHDMEKTKLALTKKFNFEVAANDLLVEKMRDAVQDVRMSESDLAVSKSELSKRNSELKVAQEYIEHVDEEIRAVKADCEKKAILLDEANGVLVTRDRELTEAQRAIERTMKREEDLEKEVAESNKRNFDLTQAKLKMDAESQGLEHTISELEEEVAKLKEQNQSLNNKLSTATDAIKVLEKKFAMSKEEAGALRSTNAQLTAENLATKRDFDKSDEQKRAIESNLATTQNRVNEMEKELRKLKDMLKEHDKKETSLNAQVKKLHSLVNTLTERLKAAEAKNLDLSHELDNSRSQLSNVHEDTAKKTNELEQLIGVLRKESIPLKESNITLSDENNGMKKKLKDLELEDARLQHALELKIVEAKLHYDEMKKRDAEILKLKSELADLKRQLTGRIQELHDLEHQVNLGKIDKEHITGELQRSEKERDTIVAEMSKANATIHDMEEQLKKARAELAFSQQQLSEKIAADVSVQYQEALESIDNLHVRLNTFENVDSDNEKLRRQLDDSEKELAHMKEAHATAQAELVKYELLKERFDDLDKKFHKLEGLHSMCPSQLLLDELRTKLGDAEKSLMGVNEMNKKLQGENDQLQEDLSNDNSDLATLNAELKKTQRLLNVANKELEDMHTSYESQSKELYDKNDEIEEKEYAIKDMRKVIDDLSEELSKLQRDVSVHKEALKSRDLEIEDLKYQSKKNHSIRSGDQSAEYTDFQTEIDVMRKESAEVVKVVPLEMQSEIVDVIGMNEDDKLLLEPAKITPEVSTPLSEPVTPTQSSPAIATPDQPIVRTVNEIKTEKKYVKPEDLVVKTIKKEKIRKGSSPPFDINSINPSSLPRYTEAATLIQCHVRGYLARLQTQRKLESVPHVLKLKIDFGDELPINDDFIKSKPDVYVLANTFRMVASRVHGAHGLKEKIYTTGKTRTIAGSTSPVWEEELTLSLIGHKSLLCLNVMSRHNFGPDTIIGQCILSPQHMQALYSKHKVHLTLPVKQVEHSVYDTKGTFMKLPPTPNPQGHISLSVNVPSIYHNMCGWFFDIKSSLLGNVYGDKIWVVLKDRKVYVYNNPYDQHVKETIDTEHIVDIEEVTYDKMEIAVDGLAVKIMKPAEVKGGLNVSYEKMWAWGDDASKTKGLWRRALVNHHHAPSLTRSVRSKINSNDAHIVVHTTSGISVTHEESVDPRFTSSSQHLVENSNN